MEKLVLVYHWGGEPCGGTDYIPFEYESKDKFVFDILEKYKDHKWIYYNGSRSEFDSDAVKIISEVFYTKGDFEYLENNVLTLEEWFNQNKIK